MLGLDAPRMLAVNPMFISVCGFAAQLRVELH
jgi:hypothetical protein